MAALIRKYKKIFAKDATINIDSGNVVFGSNAAGSPVSSNDPTTLESLSAFTTGFSVATIGGTKLPVVGEMQALKFDTDYHLAYIYQNGMQVYNNQTDYYIDNLVRKDGTGEIWKSLVDNNVGNALVEGANWTLFSNLANLGSATISTKGASLLPSPITIAVNGVDANNDIDFSAGNFQFSDGSGQGIASALTKRLDAAWAAGNNQGGLAEGLTKTANTTYHCFGLSKPFVLDPVTDTDFGFDTNINAENLLDDTNVIAAGFTKYELIESIITDDSNNIIGFTHYNFKGISKINFKVPILDISTASCSTTATLNTLTSPLGRKVNADLYVTINDPGSGDFVQYGLITSPDQTDTAPSISLANKQLNRNSSYSTQGYTYIPTITNTSSQIRARFSQNVTTYNIIINGWSS